MLSEEEEHATMTRVPLNATASAERVEVAKAFTMMPPCCTFDATAAIALGGFQNQGFRNALHALTGILRSA